MKLLLDTHILVWSTLSVSSLSKRAAELIADTSNEIFVSAATAWEISTKVRLGKMNEAIDLEREFLTKMAEAGYTLLPITAAHALRAGRMIGDHRDPFDRMIAAQALAEDIPVISMDTKLDVFGVRRLW